ncbi:zinc finger domain-containing protein [Kitasatospora cheerisanensis]|uniref:zinc finger domain-containing protein n=1 Tax=Kitasatospora cheerisanensis TaxID=81942 RepID=UPI0012EDA2D6|nr:hypothetical protein [Kitasatospora cheerisanensis]
MGAPVPPGLRSRPPEWQIPCPVDYCSAKPGLPCRSRTTGQPLAEGSHPSRMEAWISQDLAPAA